MIDDDVIDRALWTLTAAAVLYLGVVVTPQFVFLLVTTWR